MDSHLTFTITPRYRTSGPSRPNSRWISLAAAKATSTGKNATSWKAIQMVLLPKPLCAVAGHNIYDGFGQWQFGGTFLLGTNGEITSSISATGSNPYGLGCWVWFTLLGQTGITTRIISAYHPSDSSLTQTSSVWAQQCSYLLSQDDPCQPSQDGLPVRPWPCHLYLASSWQQAVSSLWPT